MAVKLRRAASKPARGKSQGPLLLIRGYSTVARRDLPRRTQLDAEPRRDPPELVVARIRIASL